MTKRILILDTDKAFVRQLVAGLSKIDTFIISQATSLQEAGNIIGHDNQDLAFVPAAKDAGMVHALRSLQPDLRLVLTKPTSQYRVSDAYSGKVQGVLIKPLLEIDLATVLQLALAQPVWVDKSRRQSQAPLRQQEETLQLDTGLIITTLQQADLGRLVQAAVFSQGRQLLAHWGEVDDTEAAGVALQAGSEWEVAQSTVQVQFVPLLPRFDEILLYVQTVEDDHLLTLVALPETPLRELRVRASRLSTSLQEILAGNFIPTEGAKLVDTGLLGRRKSYAIVWRPLRPVPASLNIPLRRTLERLAIANACVMTYIAVQAELIHLVVLCPPERDSAWAAYLFKNGSEATIQQEFGVQDILWETGHYATESSEPLSEAELGLFLAGSH